MEITSEQHALDALHAVLTWAAAAPERRHGGPSTGITYQRGRVIATWTHDGTVGLSTYNSPEDAAEKTLGMEAAYRSWTRLRNAGR